MIYKRMAGLAVVYCAVVTDHHEEERVRRTNDRTARTGKGQRKKSASFS
jgi:hypothetical protein